MGRDSYPIILVDDAQDLSSARSAMIAGVVEPCQLLLAFDEFQCLDPALRPMPIQNWLPAVCTPTSLIACRRTNNAELLQAARAVRHGEAVQQEGRRFKVALSPTPPLAATYLANAITWRVGGGSVAVLTPHGVAVLQMASSGWCAHAPGEGNRTARSPSNGKAAMKWSARRYARDWRCRRPAQCPMRWPPWCRMATRP